MPSLHVSDDQFFFLTVADDNWIYDSREDAIAALKDIMSRSPDADSESIELLQVDTGGKNWKIQQVPWSKVAFALMKEK
jgi:hypothetical protein